MKGGLGKPGAQDFSGRLIDLTEQTRFEVGLGKPDLDPAYAREKSHYRRTVFGRTRHGASQSKGPGVSNKRSQTRTENSGSSLRAAGAFDYRLAFPLEMFFALEAWQRAGIGPPDCNATQGVRRRAGQPLLGARPAQGFVLAIYYL
jgi:hypothetical protein